MVLNIIAALWGLSEATLFFVVSEILLSWIALESRKKAYIACVWSLAGALVGGSLMYLWGLLNPEQAIAALDYVPAISPQMIQTAQSDLKQKGIWSIVAGIGSDWGVPYKIYAVQSANSGISYIAFILVSIPARFGKFILVSTFFGYLSNPVLKNWSIRKKRILHIAIWIAIYGMYFSLKSN
ncbi:MAG TPA: hypothetical protein ACFYDZ_08835 [Candidatus Brocadiaceae bacterium]